MGYQKKRIDTLNSENNDLDEFDLPFSQKRPKMTMDGRKMIFLKLVVNQACGVPKEAY